MQNNTVQQATAVSRYMLSSSSANTALQANHSTFRIGTHTVAGSRGEITKNKISRVNKLYWPLSGTKGLLHEPPLWLRIKQRVCNETLARWVGHHLSVRYWLHSKYTKAL